MSADDAKDVIVRETVPDWVTALKPLVGVASGLAMIGSNPEQWVREVIAGWFVGGFMDGLQYALGWVVYGFATIRRELLEAAGPLASPYVILEGAIVGVIETMYRIPMAIADTMGLAGPLAAAFSVAFLSAFLAALAYALLYVGLNWIPGGGVIEGMEEYLDE